MITIKYPIAWISILSKFFAKKRCRKCIRLNKEERKLGLGPCIYDDEYLHFLYAHALRAAETLASGGHVEFRVDRRTLARAAAAIEELWKALHRQHETPNR